MAEGEKKEEEKKEKKAKEKMDRKNLTLISHVLGILSIVMVFFSPFVGIILGTVGLVHGMKEKTELSKKARLLNIIGIILGIVLIILSVVISKYLVGYCANNPTEYICQMYFK